MFLNIKINNFAILFYFSISQLFIFNFPSMVKFDNRDKAFALELKNRVQKCLADNGKTQFGDGAMYFKVVFWLASWAITYGLILFWDIPGWGKVLLAIAHAFTHLFIAFNISHDANHQSISTIPFVNRILSYSLDLIGVNSYLWRVAHNKEHHGFINVEGIDSNVNGYGLVRFAPWDEKKPAFQFQNWYALLAYGLSTFNYVTVKDFRIMLNSYKAGEKIPFSAILELVLFKVFYYGYVFVLPAMLLPYSFGQIFLTFLLCHAILGISLTMVFLCGHLTEGAHFPTIENEKIAEPWAVHVVKTTNDFAVNSPLFTWFVGAINIHIIHHVYPTICHTHYKLLAPVVAQTIKDFGYEYNYIPTFREAIVSHFRYLKEMGKAA